VIEAIATIRDAAEGAGVVCGLHCLSGEDAARFAPAGFPMVTAGADGGLLRAALAAALATARGGP
jgi:4-hydroxy-2-oxoheptanedioate aldolase